MSLVVTSSHRVQKIASLIRGELSRLLIAEVSDPRLKHVIITEVSLTKDLRHARVFYEAGETSDKKEIVRGLGRANGFLRKRLGDNLELRYVPELVFETDEHSSNLNRVLAALDKIKDDRGEKSE